MNVHGGGLTRAFSYVLTAVSLAACAATQFWFMRTDTPVAVDEGYMGALALRLLDQHMLPGVDGVGQRGPVLYWLVTLIQLTIGRYHWWGFRVLAWLAGTIVIVSLAVIAERVRRPLAGAIGASFYVYTMYHRYDPGAGIAVGGEQIAAPWLCAATAMLIVAQSTSSARKRAVFGAVAGVFAALAGWTKVSLLIGIAPLALWTLADFLRGAQRTWRTACAAMLPLLAGWLLPSALLALLYGATGHFSEFIYRFFTYNVEVHMSPYKDVAVVPLIGTWIESDPWTAYAWLGSMIALLVHLGYLVGANQGRGVLSVVASCDLSMIVLLQAALAFAMGMAQMRFWPHHFIAALPFAGLGLGLAVDWLLSGWRSGIQTALAVVVALSISAGLSWTFNQDNKARRAERRAGSWQPARRERVCREIQRLTRPGDYIFVWGFDADLYVSCRREPASRFVYTTPIAGIVPPFWTQARPERVARGALAETLTDLQKTKPTLIVSLTDLLTRTPITAVPELNAMLDKDYCSLGPAGDDKGRQAMLYAPKAGPHCGGAQPASK